MLGVHSTGKTLYRVCPGSVSGNRLAVLTASWKKSEKGSPHDFGVRKKYLPGAILEARRFSDSSVRECRKRISPWPTRSCDDGAFSSSRVQSQSRHQSIEKYKDGPEGPIHSSAQQESSDGERLTASDQPTPPAPSPSRATEYDRLFSILNEATLRHEPGSLTSAILLVAGTTVGAGILAIPAVTQDSGFLASAVTCIACWAYMVTTGLLLAEVNVNTMCELGSGGVSLVSMAARTLGKAGVLASCLTYVFIHYALLVAYVSRSADIITDSSGLPQWASAGIFSLSLGALCFFGSQRAVGAANGALVLGVISSFLALLLLASGGIHPEALVRADFSAVPPSIPIIALSFVYQNVVPVVATEMEGDLGRIRTAIVAGTAIPLTMFLAWDAVILGSLPLPQQPQELTAAVAAVAADSAAELTRLDPLAKLQDAGGALGLTVQVFSFFAIATSYIGFVLGLTDFLADWLRLPAGRRGGGPMQLVPHALTVLPPLALSLLNPEIFFQALDAAGTYGVLVLFGILPAAMAWSERYSPGGSPPMTTPLVPGGRTTLLLVIGGAASVITYELVSSLGGY